ncbi:hypothetical protein ABZ070_01075 [Streptomyces sp. NPDC006283]|uniref:hypothetical protein n=1 Tax=Streptomyces sp. NPDC006283 TaxID=3156741 RepID=UPI00339F8F79
MPDPHGVLPFAAAGFDLQHHADRAVRAVRRVQTGTPAALLLRRASVPGGTAFTEPCPTPYRATDGVAALPRY